MVEATFEGSFYQNRLQKWRTCTSKDAVLNVFTYYQRALQPPSESSETSSSELLLQDVVHFLSALTPLDALVLKLRSGSSVPLASIVVTDQSGLELKVALWRRAAFWVLTVCPGDVLLITGEISIQNHIYAEPAETRTSCRA